LSSATWFLGKWEYAFRRSDTRPEPFQLQAGVKEQVDFMHQTGRFGYAETAAGQLLEMRYGGGGLAFDILLPKQGTALDMNADVLAGWLGKLENRRVQVAVPKFRVESDFSLAHCLAAVGMRSAFTSEANFSGIDDRRDLQLSEVIHKAYVDVDEEGTEAAAATGASAALIAMRVPSETGVPRRPPVPLLHPRHSLRADPVYRTPPRPEALRTGRLPPTERRFGSGRL
jgi:serpin B